MEHILQFGINIDDERIKQSVYNSAKETIVAEVRNDVKRMLFGDSYNYSKRPTAAVEVLIKEVLDSHKDEIIKMAAVNLADRVFKTKKWKETMGDIIDKAGASNE